MDSQYEYQKRIQEIRDTKQKECKCKKEEREHHELAQGAEIRTIHPAWYLIVALISIGAAVLIWTIMF